MKKITLVRLSKVTPKKVSNSPGDERSGYKIEDNKAKLELELESGGDQWSTGVGPIEYRSANQNTPMPPPPPPLPNHISKQSSHLTANQVKVLRISLKLG